MIFFLNQASDCIYEFNPPISNAIHPIANNIPNGPAFPEINCSGQSGPAKMDNIK
jgi:hypothetical protein